MKYSLVILNITFMVSFVESLRRLPYIILQDENSGIKEPSLPMDGWEDLHSSMTDSEWKFLCEEQSTAQRIKYISKSPKFEYIQLFLADSKGNRVWINIRKRTQKIVHGVKCEEENILKFVLKNNRYEGLLLFSYEPYPKKRLTVLFRGFITNHLSYEDAGRYAISIFENPGIPVDIKEQQFIRVCASLFQGLSSDLVQSRAYYSIIQETEIIDGQINLYCTGVMPIEKQIFIQYNIILAKWLLADGIAITHVRGTGRLIGTKTISWKVKPEDLK